VKTSILVKLDQKNGVGGVPYSHLMQDLVL